MKVSGIGALALATALCGAVGVAVAEPLIGNSANTYGLPGLIDLPTAENTPDGMLTGTIAHFGNSTRNTLGFQITPRLTGSFRYSKITGFGAGGGDRYDRSFDLRYQILDETVLRPALSAGIQDFIGTGVYAAEYLVATKSVTPALRVTAGLGWGRLGSEGDLGSPFGDRPPNDTGTGGTANADQWFRGPAAPFAGISWQATEKLVLKAEYSSDAYAEEVSRGLIDRSSPWNFGLAYKIGQSAQLSAYYMYGSEVGVQLSFAIDPRKPATKSGYESAPLPVKPRLSPAQDPEGWGTGWTTDPAVGPGIQKAVGEVLAKDGIILEGLALSHQRAEVRIRNTRYSATPQAAGRVARVLTRALPASVETFTITQMTGGIAAGSVSLRRSDLEALEQAGSAAMYNRAVFSDPAGRTPQNLALNATLYPRLTWSLLPYLEASLFDPVSPVRADVGLRLAGRYEVSPGFVLSGSLRKKIAGNLGDDVTPSTSLLPHVRSDSSLYYAKGDPAIEHLSAAWFTRPGENLYGRLSVGYLEAMFGGVSAELLWHPIESRLALGAELNYAVQRDFDQLFAFQDYDVVTGHASAYYDFGSGYHMQVDVGRYLAGDWGTTLSLDREFANGWKVGAYATFTDVSSEEFGEGSFDKGIRITVPIGWATGQPTRDAVTTTLRSLSRDGGARLSVDDRLYGLTREAHQPQMEATWGRFWR